MSGKEEVVDTSDYKLDKSGKKIKAHRLVFNKGEDDGKKGISEMKKKYKDFVEQHSVEEEQGVAEGWKEELEEGWDDMLAHGKKVAADATKDSTKTKHDVKKTSTGTVYTKQRDADGMSKEFKRDNDQTKRGRGRPKKNSFSEAAEFLMSLDEEAFDSLMEEGFDAFAEQFEQLDELDKKTLGSYVKKSKTDLAHRSYDQGSDDEMGVDRSKRNDRKLGNRLKGINKAVDRLTK